MKPTNLWRPNAKRRSWRDFSRAGLAVKILLVLVAGVGFVTGIGLGSVAARQIASRALAQQGTPPLTVPAHEAATRPPASVRPSPRGSVPAEGEKATAVGPTEDDPGDLDDTVDDVVPA